jgi:hypothetical protein
MSSARFNNWLSSKGIKKNMVKQIVYAEKNTASAYSTGSTTYLATGFTASINIDPGNKVLILCNLSAATNYWALGARFTRNGTVIGSGIKDSSAQNVGGFGATHYMANYIHLWYPCSYTFLDSPPSSGTQTYELELHAYNGTAYLNRTNSNWNYDDYEGRPISTITLMEFDA